MDNWADPRRMTSDYIKKEAIKKRFQSSEILKNINCLDEWESRKAYIKGKLYEAIGGLPEKAPLNAVTVSKIEKRYYIIENIILHPLPGIPLNLNLYLPLNVVYPVPAVIFATGHSSKADAVHQYPVQGLVRKGYAVATFDCYGRGERIPGNEHYDVGVLSWLNRNNMLRYFINDNIRVLDYLGTRKEIDSGNIGCTGTSGGGHTTIFHAALDERVKCAVPVCTVASFTDYILIDYPGCPEYYPNGLLGAGIDIQDIISLIAPRPFMFIGGGRDIINCMPSMMQSCEHAARIYKLYGNEENIVYHIDENAGHGYNCNMRTAMYDWMDRHLSPGYLGNFTDLMENDNEVLADRSDIEFLKDNGSSLSEYEFGMLEHNKRNWKADYGKDLLEKLLGLGGKAVSYRCIEYKIRCMGLFNAAEAVIETENGIFVPMVIIYPLNASESKGVFLVFTDDGKDALTSPNTFSEEYKNGYVVVAADLRGMGSSSFKRNLWDQWSFCSADRTNAGGAVALGYPIAGQRVYDATAVYRFVSDKYNCGNPVKVYGDGNISVVARLFSLLNGIKDVKIYSEIIPYEKLMKAQRELMKKDDKNPIDEKCYIYRYADIVPGILKYFDLSI